MRERVLQPLQPVIQIGPDPAAWMDRGEHAKPTIERRVACAGDDFGYLLAVGFYLGRQVGAVAITSKIMIYARAEGQRQRDDVTHFAFVSALF